MAGLIFSVKNSTEFSLSTLNSKHCVLYLASPDANSRAKLLSWMVSFDGANPLAEPINVELARVTAGSGTFPVTTPTPVLENAGTEVSRFIAKEAATANPTIVSILRSFHVHPQTSYECIFALGQEILIPGGTAIAIFATPITEAVNAMAQFVYEE